MSHYKSNLRDIEFNLFEVLGLREVLGTGPFTEVDEDTARDMLAEVNRLALGPAAESFADADRNPPVFDPATGSVALPESFKKSFRALMDAEWWRLSVPPELGGTVAPRSLQWALASCILGANPALWMYYNGPTFAAILWNLGTPAQKRFAELAIEREWGATMVLTEPDAGSDVGAGLDQGGAAARRHLAHRGRQALHHWRRARHGGEHLPPGARQAGGRRGRH